MVSQQYVYGHGDKALNILKARLKQQNVKTTLWKAGIMPFQNMVIHLPRSFIEC